MTSLKELTACKWGEEDAPAYYASRRPFAFAHDCYGRIFANLIKDLQNTGRELPTGGVLAVNLDALKKTITAYFSVIKQIAEDEKEHKKKPEESASKQVSVLYGLTASEQAEYMKKTQEIALQWFTGKCQRMEDRNVYMILIDEIRSRQWMINTERYRFFYKAFQLKCSKEPISIASANYEACGIKKSKKALDPATLNCADFALLRIYEKRVKKHISRGTSISMETLPKTLKLWSYIPVTTPRENDLVMYINYEERPTHLGRYLASGQVESKLGSLQTYFHWHNLFDVPPNYGNRVVFWRKKQ